MRASLCPISTAIESSAPAMTHAVTGSILVCVLLTPTSSPVRPRPHWPSPVPGTGRGSRGHGSRGHAREEQIARVVGARRPAGRDEDRRVALEDDRGPGYVRVEREAGPLVEARRVRIE